MTDNTIDVTRELADQEAIVTPEDIPEKSDFKYNEPENVVDSKAQSSVIKMDDDLTTGSDTNSLEIRPDNRHVRRIIAEEPDYNLTTMSELELKFLSRIIENFAFDANM